MMGKSTAQARVHAVVHGYVQGVNFRYYATRTARGPAGNPARCPRAHKLPG